MSVLIPRVHELLSPSVTFPPSFSNIRNTAAISALVLKYIVPRFRIASNAQLSWSMKRLFPIIIFFDFESSSLCEVSGSIFPNAKNLSTCFNC